MNNHPVPLPGYGTIEVSIDAYSAIAPSPDAFNYSDLTSFPTQSASVTYEWDDLHSLALRTEVNPSTTAVVTIDFVSGAIPNYESLVIGAIGPGRHLNGDRTETNFDLDSGNTSAWVLADELTYGSITGNVVWEPATGRLTTDTLGSNNMAFAFLRPDAASTFESITYTVTTAGSAGSPGVPDGVNFFIGVQQIPEPSTALLAMVAVPLLLRRRRK